MEESNPKKLLINSLVTKAAVKQKVYDNTLGVLSQTKSILTETQKEINAKLKSIDKRILIEYKDRGKFEAELKVGGDILIFSMHTNTFDFDHSHKVHQLSYVRKDHLNSFCGIIHIYNFLSDSFKYNRTEDLGYLIARLFINRENHFFLEGKRQLGYLYNDFTNRVIDKAILRQIIYSVILYALDFDLFVPPYDAVSILSVEQMIQKFQNPKFITGKRMGFHFNYEDVKDNEP